MTSVRITLAPGYSWHSPRVQVFRSCSALIYLALSVVACQKTDDSLLSGQIGSGSGSGGAGVGVGSGGSGTPRHPGSRSTVFRHVRRSHQPQVTRDGIARLGLTVHHRRSFRPIGIIDTIGIVASRGNAGDG